MASHNLNVNLNWDNLEAEFDMEYALYKEVTATHNGDKIFPHFKNYVLNYFNKFKVCFNLDQILYVTWWNDVQVYLIELLIDLL